MASVWIRRRIMVAASCLLPVTAFLLFSGCAGNLDIQGKMARVLELNKQSNQDTEETISFAEGVRDRLLQSDELKTLTERTLEQARYIGEQHLTLTQMAAQQVGLLRRIADINQSIALASQGALAQGAAARAWGGEGVGLTASLLPVVKAVNEYSWEIYWRTLELYRESTGKEPPANLVLERQAR